MHITLLFISDFNELGIFVRIARFFNIFTLFLFCGLIFSPSLVMFFSKKEVWSSAEKRTLAKFPSSPQSLSAIAPYFSLVNNYLQDHFGLRDFLIHRYQRELKKRFNKAPSIVIAGLDGWLFLDNFGLIGDFFGYTPLSDAELDAWLAEIRHRKEWLAQQGVHYLHIIAPNKQALYPQYLMENGKELKGVTRFEQLEKRLSPVFPEYIANLHAALEARQNEGLLYFKNDTHWNTRGVYFAYLEILKTLRQWFPDEAFRDDFELGKDVAAVGGNLGHGGDLATIIGAKGGIEKIPVLKPFKTYASIASIEKYHLSRMKYSSAKPSYAAVCKNKKLRAVVFRDSFFVQMEPLFSENFAEVIYLWKRYDQKNVEEIMQFWKPDIVIDMTVERHAFDFL